MKRKNDLILWMFRAEEGEEKKRGSWINERKGWPIHDSIQRSSIINIVQVIGIIIWRTDLDLRRLNLLPVDFTPAILSPIPLSGRGLSLFWIDVFTKLLMTFIVNNDGIIWPHTILFFYISTISPERPLIILLFVEICIAWVTHFLTCYHQSFLISASFFHKMQSCLSHVFQWKDDQDFPVIPIILSRVLSRTMKLGQDE